MKDVYLTKCDAGEFLSNDEYNLVNFANRVLERMIEQRLIKMDGGVPLKPLKLNINNKTFFIIRYKKEEDGIIRQFLRCLITLDFGKIGFLRMQKQVEDIKSLEELNTIIKYTKEYQFNEFDTYIIYPKYEFNEQTKLTIYTLDEFLQSLKSELIFPFF